MSAPDFSFSDAIQQVADQNQLILDRFVIQLAESGRFELTQEDRKRLNLAYLRIAKLKAAGYE